jgi:acyl-CoA reductase-like NAD-dependent aldehyde dehydrogenase
MQTLEREDLVLQCMHLRERVEQLETALQTRIVIEQAKGVLAERLHVHLEDAFSVLRLAARNERMKIHALAKRVVEDQATPEAITRALARQARWRAVSQRERNEVVQACNARVHSSHEEQMERLRKRRRK